ncbi:hypothetical protein BDV37DRAFT_289837 [Aspergillus pseudonomiae]|uniref:Uncharacterized protein n=1 Tax=Aspergillus pseudonomiae TaxID=1506151 RepID=A0A5N7CRY8_9EURO|nr:uncharacterized protein BDV37DRAFT_289837 [Aspergillus pseudonomiae]KAE8396956.1 hypothetical protein BDV37DRAFT_289837 [Aspergillus pseudonomiae]
MAQSLEWDPNTPLKSIEDDMEDSLDIQFTDTESESEYTETNSDRLFIDTEDDLPTEHYEKSYSPSDTMETSSDDSTSSQVDGVGIYGDISVLDEREISGKDGPVTQIWINGWVDENIFRQVMDIIRGG